MSKNFSHQNLQGQNFQGQNLTGADFSYANIRGANFTNSQLTGANFEGTLAGIPPHINILTQGLMVVLAGISSFISVMAITFAGGFFTPEFVQANSWLPGIVFLILLGLFLGLSWRFSLKTALLTIIAGALFFSPFVIIKPWFVAWDWTVTGLWIGVGTAAWVWILSLVGTIAWIKGEAITWRAMGIAAWMVGLIAIFFGSGTSLFAGLYSSEVWGWVNLWGGFFYLGIEIFAGYISRQAGIENQHFVLLRKIALIITSLGGTSFYRADLTEVNFSQALLQQTDFRQANLTRTCWLKSRKLELARVSKTMLENQVIRKLLVSGDGRNQSYIAFDFKGVNLDGANLSRADLREANLNDSTLKKACLNGANLSGIQALNTNFNEAKMTGVLVSDWNLNEKTQLQKVVCEYFYRSSPKPERYPLNRELRPGEFTRLFQPAPNSISLYFDRGIDWKVFLYVFKKIQESYPDIQFEILGIKKKGEEILVIDLQASHTISVAKFQAEFIELYDTMLIVITDKYEGESWANYLQENSQLLMIISQLANRGVSVE